MASIGTKLKFKVERDPMDSDQCVIVSGKMRFTVYRRTMKFNGWSGYDAYLPKVDQHRRTPEASASGWFQLLRKLERIEGVDLN